MLNIISNNFRKILLFAVLILYSTFVGAVPIDAISDTGIITLEIVNRPPLITNIYFSPETAFEDTKLECIAEINDEKPNETLFTYKWYVNNALVETDNNYLTGFQANDLIRCEVTPIDNENAIGETKSTSIILNKKSALNAITGFLVKNYDNNILTIFNLIFDIF